MPLTILENCVNSLPDVKSIYERHTLLQLKKSKQPTKKPTHSQNLIPNTNFYLIINTNNNSQSHSDSPGI